MKRSQLDKNSLSPPFCALESDLVFDASPYITYQSMRVKSGQFRLQRNPVRSLNRRRGILNRTYPSNVSSTALRTLSPRSFQPTCNNHQLRVRYLLSTSSSMPSGLHIAPLTADLSSTSSSSTEPPLNSVSRCEPAAGPKPKLPNTRFEAVSSASRCSRTGSSCSCSKTEATYFERARKVSCKVVKRQRSVVK